MADYGAIISGILDREGRGYTDNPADRGGPTKFGIDAATLGASRRLGRPATAAEVQALDETEAAAIYRVRYIDGPGFAAVSVSAPAVALELIDTGVNMGVGTPGPWLQRGLNALNRGGQDYADIAVDGAIGPASLRALGGLIQRRGLDDAQAALLKVLNGFQVVRYVELCEAHPDDESFAFGWIKNRVGF